MSQNDFKELHRVTCLYLLEQADENELVGGVPERIRLKADRILTATNHTEAAEFAKKARASMDIHVIASRYRRSAAKAETLEEQAQVAEREAAAAEAEGNKRGAKSRRKAAEKLRKKAQEMKG